MEKNSEKYKPVFYIAHTFTERHFVRDKLVPRIQKLGCTTINPFYEADGSWKPSRPEIKLADESGESAAWVKLVKSRTLDIVTTDLSVIDKSDGIIAFMPKGSAGTTCEIWTCGGIFKWLKSLGYDLPRFQGKVTYLITSSPRLLMHPWMKYGTNRVFKSHESFLKYLEKSMPRLRQKLYDRRKQLEESHN